MPEDGLSTSSQVMSATDSEMDVVFGGPALAANRAFVMVGQPGVRITFVEQAPTGAGIFFRNAVTLHPLDAIALQRLLKTALKDLEAHFIANQALSEQSEDA